MRREERDERLVISAHHQITIPINRNLSLVLFLSLLLNLSLGIISIDLVAFITVIDAVVAS